MASSRDRAEQILASRYDNETSVHDDIECVVNRALMDINPSDMLLDNSLILASRFMMDRASLHMLVVAWYFDIDKIAADAQGNSERAQCLLDDAANDVASELSGIMRTINNKLKGMSLTIERDDKHLLLDVSIESHAQGLRQMTDHHTDTAMPSPLYTCAFCVTYMAGSTSDLMSIRRRVNYRNQSDIESLIKCTEYECKSIVCDRAKSKSSSDRDRDDLSVDDFQHECKTLMDDLNDDYANMSVSCNDIVLKRVPAISAAAGVGEDICTVVVCVAVDIDVACVSLGSGDLHLCIDVMSDDVTNAVACWMSPSNDAFYGVAQLAVKAVTPHSELSSECPELKDFDVQYGAMQLRNQLCTVAFMTAIYEIAIVHDEYDED